MLLPQKTSPTISMTSKTITIRRIELPDDAIARLSDAEREFLFLSGFMLNELNSLNKVFSWCLNSDTDKNLPEIVGNANVIQSMVYARILAGKVCEGFQSLSSTWFGHKGELSTALTPQLHPEAKNAIDELKKYFNKPNAIYNVRNAFAFHYGSKDRSAGWRQVPAGLNIEIICAEHRGNNLYLGSELVTSYGLSTMIDSDDLVNGQSIFINDVQYMTKCLTIFLEAASLLLIEKVLGGTIEENGQEEIVPVSANFSEVNIPYFCAPD